MNKWSLSKYGEALGVVLVLLLALYLRVSFYGINSFGFDEARVSHMALQMARGGQFAQMGMQSSTAVPNLPAAVWIFALPYLITPDPIGANIFIGLVGVTAVLALWWLARQAWGPWAGFSVALLLAVSPIAVSYSRSVWSQDLLVPLTIFWALTAVVGIANKRSWALALHTFLVGFTLQVHFAGIPLILGSLWLGIRYQLWKQWKPILIGGIFAVLAILPYVQIVWCCGPGAQQDWLTLFGMPSITNTNVLQTLAHVATSSNWESLNVGMDWQWSPPLSTLLAITSGVLIIMMSLGFILSVWQTYQFRRTSPDWESVLTTLIPVWVLTIPLYYFRFKTEAGIHYFLTALPGLLLLIGLLIGWQRAKNWWRWGIALIVIAITIIQSASIIQALNVTAEQFTKNGMGTPLRYHRDAAQMLKDGSPIVVHTFDDNAAYAGDAALFSILLWDYPHRIVDGRSIILYPAAAQGDQPVHMLSTYENIPAWQELVANDIAVNSQDLPRRQGELPYKVSTIDQFELPHFNDVQPIRLENGSTLLGWHARKDGDIWRLFTMWQVSTQPEMANYHQFNHFHDSNSVEPIAIHDTRLSSSSWRDGDIIITWVDFNSEGQTAPFWVDVGMYTWPEVARTPRIDHDGDPLQPIRLGPFGDEAGN